MLKIFGSFFCFAVIVVVYSCNQNSPEAEEKVIKSSISQYVSDEIFKSNSNFELIEIKLNKVESLPLDSLFRDQLKTRAYSLISMHEKTEPEQMKQEGYLNYLLNNDEGYKKLSEISKEKNVKFGTDKKGKYVYAYVKGVINRQIGKQNLLLENSFFVLDDNNKVILSYVNWDYFRQR